MSSRIEIATGDALDRGADWGVFAGVFANPPFDREYETRAPAEARRHAHITEMSLGQWVAALADRVDTAPAGAGIVGALFTIFVILLITDILGFTKVFPFTRSIQ